MSERTDKMENAANVSTVIDAARPTVWHALIDPASISRYFMGATVDTNWQVGHPVTWSGEWKGNAYQDKGEVLCFEPDKRLSFSHWSPMGGAADAPENYHVVTIELDDAGRGTKVTLTQSNLVGGITRADREHRRDYEQNWSTVLAGLKDVVEG